MYFSYYTLLSLSESGQCPECDMMLKRTKFRAQVFEDPLVEKEIDIRRRVCELHYLSDICTVDNKLVNILHMLVNHFNKIL